MSFKAFLDAAKSIVTLGSSANAAARQDIRDVVGKLGDELDRALSITDSYLVGAKFSIDDVDRKLMGSYLEHHICAGLYQLADKFEQVFDPTRFSVSISNYNEIPKLIGELKNGEQVVLDDLSDIANNLRDYSNQLHSGIVNTEEVLKSVEYHREQVVRYRKQIKSKRRDLLAKL
jgi:hypothetical protein